MHTPSACSETNPLCGCRTDWRARRVCGSSPPKWCRRLAISRAESAIGTGPLLNWGWDRQLFREFYAAYDRATGSAAGYPSCAPAPLPIRGRPRSSATSIPSKLHWPGYPSRKRPSRRWRPARSSCSLGTRSTRRTRPTSSPSPRPCGRNIGPSWTPGSSSRSTIPVW
jgi:hypothetical protein